ncbi:hypothetical protein BGX27_010904, partial [Mortierella sp. AM989]
MLLFKTNRFQKLSQARNSGIIVVNQPTAVEDSRPGRGLGLGHKTGSNPSGQRGSRIVTNRNGAAGPGLHTAGGLARAMQERGTGVTDAFLLAPELATSSLTGGGAARNKKGRGVGLLTSNSIRGGGNNQNTQASRHKSLILGRPGRKQAGNGNAVQQQQQQPPQRGGKAARAGRGGSANAPASAVAAAAAGGKGKKGAASSAAAGGKGGKAEKGTKGSKAKPTRANAQSLDSELSEYMMKDEHTATSLLDNDLDSYMADKPEDEI